MQLQLMPFPINMFSHNAEAKMLVTDISDFGLPVGMLPFGPIYDDACDEGFALHNPCTGSTTYWYYVDEVAEDGDITHWVLRPTNESCRKHPGVQCYTMHILND